MQFRMQVAWYIAFIWMENSDIRMYKYFGTHIYLHNCDLFGKNSMEQILCYEHIKIKG